MIRRYRQNRSESFIDHQVDVMILNLVHSSSASQITDICSESGIPVIYINRQPYEAEMLRWEEEELQAAYVGADARQSGTYQGEEIAATETRGDINGDGTVSYVMIQGEPENMDTQYRSAYSVKALEDAGIKTKELMAENGDWNRDRGADIARKALEEFGKEIDVIFCNNDAMALGALTAVREAGRETGKDIYLTGIDALPDAVQEVEEGELTATVLNDYFSQSHTAAAAAVQYIQGGEPETVNMIDYIKVTKDNAESLLKRIS
ncbi:substrate-binding domain-containing protein [uncultured Blautia sp.]|uniref:substrate-binding domain-containing protein n=1 Tax=uncultured Blautia sp. TaxID=765821 RepID=UPI00280B348B|nr:substrate-binding domain-containing protein [uncultured Blautia sp.]